jgi:hypothetical protein
VDSSTGRHRAATSKSVPTVSAAGVAVGAAAILGLTPALSADPELTAEGKTYYLRGTNIGDEPTDAEFQTFMGRVFQGTGTAQPPVSDRIEYNAGIWPFSRGGLNDLKWNASVQQGVSELGDKNPGTGDVVFAFSQGAVVASQYKAAHPDTGATFILFENPNRPNGGVMQRFNGLTIPILDITFSGATEDTDDLTLDIARQYSGWSDFPTYPLNLLATANAVMGIIYLHGPSQRYEDLEAELAAIQTDTNAPDYNPAYYQEHGNTRYYLIPTERLPLLMPLDGILPKNVLDAIDKPLRAIIETGYDRRDYSAPTGARLFPRLSDLKVDLDKDLSNPTAQTVAQDLAKDTHARAPKTLHTVNDRNPELTLPKPDVRERISARQLARAAKQDKAEKADTAEATTTRTRPERPGAALRTALRSFADRATEGRSAKPRADAGATQD